MLWLKCKLHKSRALPAWFTREGLGYSRRLVTLEVVLEWLVKKDLWPGCPRPHSLPACRGTGPWPWTEGLELGLGRVFLLLG